MNCFSAVVLMLGLSGRQHSTHVSCTYCVLGQRSTAEQVNPTVSTPAAKPEQASASPPAALSISSGQQGSSASIHSTTYSHVPSELREYHLVLQGPPSSFLPRLLVTEQVSSIEKKGRSTWPLGYSRYLIKSGYLPWLATPDMRIHITNMRMFCCLSGKRVEVSQCNLVPPEPSHNMQPPASCAPAAACSDSVSQHRTIRLQDKIQFPLLQIIPFLSDVSLNSFPELPVSPVFSSHPKLSIQKPDASCSGTTAPFPYKPGSCFLDD